ncbi:MAG: phosphate ABC transporter permease PstA [Proteobacteria bacterium]|nr:phosphate ABC transporter permease PstA [Pseudomonadota bacterium]
MKIKIDKWLSTGTPWIWLNAGAVAISIVMVVGLLLILVARGMTHFWPSDVMQAIYTPPVSSSEPLSTQIIGEFVERESVIAQQLISSGIPVDPAQEYYDRQLLKLGNRDLTGADFSWVLTDFISGIEYPEHLVVLERREWGNFYGFLREVREGGETVDSADSPDQADTNLWLEFTERLQRALSLHDEIYRIENLEIGQINYGMERLRLEQRRLELNGQDSIEAIADINARRTVLESEYESLQDNLLDLYSQINRDSALFGSANDRETEIEIADIVRAYQPNKMNLLAKIGGYFSKLGEFLTDDPREANTEGGIFPAIFGTVMMVMLMSVFVTPFGVVAAVYLREYAQQGFITRAVRIAVNNLAGVPSIVYGVFGLGFFIYILGGEIDQLFYPEALPAPTFGTPGLLWASITLALLTVPVVIVATEEGLARIPRSVREGSLALGATKFETLWRVVLPMASPAMMTGLILAVARAAGEVAPLMLVGVVKLAPSLPLDGNYPYLHLEQKFMHLGFHIYDVGFQSPNIEAARPLVFATALLLVIVIALLNFSAVALRNHLREKYKSLDV